MERTLIDGRYELGEPLGGGGMARVYLARDTLLERDVAVKVLREQYAEDEQFVERFRREAQSAASLSHPNIVQTYDRGEAEDGRYYIAMEHVPGGTLSDRLSRDGSLQVHTAAEVASQVADALGAAHEQGVIHRDIKPHNILVTEQGDVKVADFGIARAASETSISKTSAVMGTAAYMSPEQALGEEVSPTGDLYSLGVVLYEMLTGQVPFMATSPTAISLKHVNEEPKPPTEINSSIPEGMEALILRLLAKDPADRYASAAELIEDLHRVGEGFSPLNAGVVGAAGAAAEEGEAAVASDPTAEPEASTHPGGGSRSHRRAPLKRSLKRFLAAGVLLLALLGAVGWLAWPGSEDPGVAGTLEGLPGETREAIEDAGRVLVSATDSVADPVAGAEEIEVPGVEGLSQEAARERLDQAGFEAEIRPRQSSAQDTGLVLEQSVAAGGRAEEGSTILLAVGTGPGASAQSASSRDAETPDLVGTPYPQAESALQEAGLTVGGAREVPSRTVATGEIAEQDPGPGASVEQGTPVYLATSTGPPQAGLPQAGSPQAGPPQGSSWQSTPGAREDWGSVGESAGGNGGYDGNGGVSAGAGDGAAPEPYTASGGNGQGGDSDEQEGEGAGYEQYD